MAHTYTNLLTHALFSTKERQPMIRSEMKSDLYAVPARFLNRNGSTFGEVSSCTEQPHDIIDGRVGFVVGAFEAADPGLMVGIGLVIEVAAGKGPAEALVK